MKKQFMVILAILFFLNLVFRTLFFKAFIDLNKYKSLYSYVKKEHKILTHKLTTSEYKNTGLLYKNIELEDQKKELTGKNDYLRYLNKKLSCKQNKYNRKIAGKKNYKTKKYKTPKKKYYKKKKTNFKKKKTNFKKKKTNFKKKKTKYKKKKCKK